MAAIRIEVRENVLSDPRKVTLAMYADHIERLGRSWVGELDGEIVGFSSATRADASIWALFVRPEHEGRGIGKRLLALATAWLFELGAERVTLSTDTGTRADRFYAAQGWRRGALKDAREVVYTLERAGAHGLAAEDGPAAVRAAEPRDAAEWLRLRSALWPEEPEAEQRVEVDAFFAGRRSRGPWGVLLAQQAARVVGFAEVSVRPHAEGCRSARVAYLEGWYVTPDWRGRGVGRALIEAAERWARARGCREFASDVDPDNAVGRAAHHALGFEDAGLVHGLRKDLAGAVEPARALASVALVVREYDEAIAWFTSALGFELLEDRPLAGDKRWVIVAPSGARGARLLLARAATPAQAARVGDAAGGRVAFFLETSDLAADRRRMLAHGVRFEEEPREEPYGTVAVFRDLYGNRWDLVQPR